MSDVLERLAAEQEAQETEETRAQETGQAEGGEPEREPIEPSNGAAELAEFAAQTVAGFLGIFEPRMNLEAEVGASREEVAPAVEKYELHQGGTGEALGFKPELMAGLWLGRFIKSIISQFKFWKKHDRESEEASENGEERKHQSNEQAHTVPSAERVREKPNTEAARGYTEPRL